MILKKVSKLFVLTLFGFVTSFSQTIINICETVNLSQNPSSTLRYEIIFVQPCEFTIHPTGWQNT